MDKVLIDTDVILDLFIDRQPFAEYSAQVISLCEADKIKGFVTPVIYSNVYYLLRQTAIHNKVIDSLKQFLVSQIPSSFALINPGLIVCGG